MQYTEYKLELRQQPQGAQAEDILDLYASALAEVGFDSFEHQGERTLLAYIPTDLCAQNHAQIDEVLSAEIFPGAVISVTQQVMPDVNWNEVWEQHYFQPIIIGDNLCRIRAPFHPPSAADPQTEVIINPKMAFGTGNHETTALMMSYILEHPMAGLRVLDMGAGTGILGILALKQGAQQLTAIDIDEWAYENILENASLNGVEITEVLQGDASSLAGRAPYDLILANITRNILFEDMPAYVQVLQPGGRLVLSGFYEEDAPQLISRAEALGLACVSVTTAGRWARVVLAQE